jgi:anti-anti-sigma factor
VSQATLAIDIEPARAYAVVRPRGELDIAAPAALAVALAAAHATGRRVVVDLRELEFMDSSCLRLRAPGAGERELYLIPGAPCVQAVFTLTGMHAASRWISAEQLA